MSTTTTPPTTDGGRERELEDIGISRPTVEWLDNDRVLVTMRREELDDLVAGYGRSGSQCECIEASNVSYAEGHQDGYREALAHIDALAPEHGPKKPLPDMTATS